MAIEIERKFLVRNDTWRNHAADGVFYRQGYLASSPSCSIRVRSGGGKGYLNLKSATLGVTRKEYEYEVPEQEANEMLNLFCEGPLIEKTRYNVEHAGHIWEVDVFAGDNDGLIVAEIELDDADEAFELPGWAGEEVSHDSRYYNVCLVTHPFKDW
ncbi:MAG: CYTH domain-containing protein [Gammaproteobacteria bacterium]